MMNVIMNPDLSEDFSAVRSLVKGVGTHVDFVNGLVLDSVEKRAVKTVQRGRLCELLSAESDSFVVISEVYAAKAHATFSCSTKSGKNCIHGELMPDGRMLMFRNTDANSSQILDCSWEVVEYV